MQNQVEFVWLGIFIGAAIIGFIWVIVSTFNNLPNQEHYKYVGGKVYSTKLASRIHGIFGQRITVDGLWCQRIESLWRTFPDLTGKRRFFILQIDEIEQPRQFVVSEKMARKWIEDCCDKELAKKLLRDWIDKKEIDLTIHH